MSGLSLYAAICRGVSPCFSLASGEAPGTAAGIAVHLRFFPGVRGGACPDERFGDGETRPGRGPVQGGDAIPVRAVSGSAAGEEFERRVFLSGAQGGGEQGLAVFPRALADVGSGAQERRDHEGAAEAHRKR